MVSRITFLEVFLTTCIFKQAKFTFTQGWITNEAIAAHTRKATTRVDAMCWKFAICHLWISTAKRDPLGLD